MINFVQTEPQAMRKIPRIMLDREYQFAIHNKDAQSEKPGDMALRSDRAAVAFGRSVVQQLIHKYAGYYSGWTLDITDDKRAVSSVPFK